MWLPESHLCSIQFSVYCGYVGSVVIELYVKYIYHLIKQFIIVFERSRPHDALIDATAPSNVTIIKSIKLEVIFLN